MKKWWILALTLLLSITLYSPTHAQNQSVHIVKSGDTLWKISKWFQIGLSEIINANPQFKNPDLIYPGDKVYVPRKQQIKQIEYEVIKLTNQKRAENGLGPLKADWQLSRVARYKSNDMKQNGYFSHQSPTFGSPFEMMRDFNIHYSSAGENIAMGQTTAQAVVESWMKSPGHRKNILSSNYTYIGVGYAKGGSGRYYWTQMFIRK